MKQIAVLALGAFLLASAPAFASDSTKASYQKTLSSVPAAEMPAKAADLVKQAKAREWSTRTIEVVKSALAINPAAAPAVVGAISKSVPDMAAVAAGTAATEQPKQAAAIAKAATAAAPSKAGKITAAVCSAVPALYREVAVAVSEAAPTAGKDILKGVASAVPALKRGIDQSLLNYQGAVPQVAASLDSARAVASSPETAAGPLPKGPTVGAPFVPLSGTPVSIQPNPTAVVPPGGRSYAEP